MSIARVGFAKATYLALKTRLLSEVDDQDELALQDRLERTSDLIELLKELLRSHLIDEALTHALRTRIKAMQQRVERLTARAETKRLLVAKTMAECDLRQIVAPEFTASLRPNPPAVVVTNEALIPEDFWKQQAPKLDRRGVAAALKSGQTVPGAMLSNGGFTVAVRTL